MRRMLLLVVLAAAVHAHVASAADVALPAPIARPNPATYALKVDYRAPLTSADGGTASLPPLDPAVTEQAFHDLQYLAYLKIDDLGGFIPAPRGQHALSSGGHTVVGANHTLPQIPLFGEAANGGIKSYTFTGGPVTTPPDNGKGPVPGLGVPPATPVPPTGPVPPANGGFGGRPPEGGGTTTETSPTPTAPPGTTTTPRPTTTTTTTTTTPTTTTTSPPRPPTTTTTTTTPPPSCGTAGIDITSNLTNCQIYAINMAPGDSTRERLTITNTTSSTYTLSLQAAGTQNHLWNDLSMAVWEEGTAPPSTPPRLLDWTSGYNNLTTLAPGQTVVYLVELALDASAGNGDQNMAAVISFRWRATG